ncbi:MAG: hypothetical protein R2991_01230 [Thermoanaerobaculia bacterium]
MATPQNQRGFRGWYKISVDTIRGWILLAIMAGLAYGGYHAYGLVEQRYLEGRVSLVLREARSLDEAVRSEGGHESYRKEYETATEHLAEARRHVDASRMQGALRSAESGRVILASILRQLHRLESTGEAHFITVQGSVEYRRGERGDWREARPRDVLYAGDYVKTAGGTSAEIMAIDGTVYTVRSDTVILVGRSSLFGDQGTERSITLDHGWVDLSTSLARSTVTTPGAQARVERDSTAVVAWDERRRLGQFAAYRGSMDVAGEGGQNRAVRRLEHVVQRGRSLSSPERLPAAPLPIDPADDLEIPLDSSDRLVLTWQPVAGAQRYALQVARNRLFVHKIIDVDDRAKTQATLGLRGDGTFVWRVAAFTADGVQGPWSTPRRFRVVGEPPVPIAEPSPTPEES